MEDARGALAAPGVGPEVDGFLSCGGAAALPGAGAGVGFAPVGFTEPPPKVPALRILVGVMNSVNEQQYSDAPFSL